MFLCNYCIWVCGVPGRHALTLKSAILFYVYNKGSYKIAPVRIFRLIDYQNNRLLN